MRGARNIPGRLVEPGPVATGKGNACAGMAQDTGEVRTEAPRGTGDQSDPAGQVKQIK